MSRKPFSKKREFVFTKANFEVISELAFDLTGIKLGHQKEEMIYGRIAPRIRDLDLRSFDDYCEMIASKGAAERHHFTNAITTNLTSFFRESYHFDFLAAQLAQLKSKNPNKKRLRIWSAGCSTGMEPYSIAMTVLNAGFGIGWDINILATDIDTVVLEKARQGLYAEKELSGVDQATLRRYFIPIESKQGVRWRVKERVKSLISFKPLNLMTNWPAIDLVDVIFCRNVIIYFNKEIQRSLFKKFAANMNPDAVLFIGNAESLAGVSTSFKALGQTTYRYTDGGAATDDELRVRVDNVNPLQVSMQPAVSTELKSGKARILAVDDQLVMRRMVKMALQNLYDVDLANDGVDGFDKATGSKQNYDLIITDLNMPNLDGIGLIRRIRALKRYQGVPILVVSTDSQHVKKITAKEAGANGWIVKPVHPDSLNQAVKRLLS